MFDGATGTHLQGQGLTADDFGGEQLNGCNEYLVVSKPSAVENVHRDYLEAGCGCRSKRIRSGRPRLCSENTGLRRSAYELNLRAARIARERCRRLLDAGSAPVCRRARWARRRNSRRSATCTFAAMAAAYREQARGLLEGGVDLLCVETCQDILQVKAALCGIFECFAERAPARPGHRLGHRGNHGDAPAGDGNRRRPRGTRAV